MHSERKMSINVSNNTKSAKYQLFKLYTNNLLASTYVRKHTLTHKTRHTLGVIKAAATTTTDDLSSAKASMSNLSEQKRLARAASGRQKNRLVSTTKQRLTQIDKKEKKAYVMSCEAFERAGEFCGKK